METLVEILTILGSTGALAALGKFLADIWRWFSKRRGIRQQHAAFFALREVYATLRTLISLTGASRVAIMSLHNGGDVPKVGKPLYFTALYEDFRAGKESLGALGKRREVDSEYITMILSLLEKGSVWIETKDLAETCILRDIATLQGTKNIHKILLGRSPEQTVYLSCHYDTDYPNLDPRIRQHLSAAKTLLQRIFEEQGQIFQVDTRDIE